MSGDHLKYSPSDFVFTEFSSNYGKVCAVFLVHSWTRSVLRCVPVPENIKAIWVPQSPGLRARAWDGCRVVDGWSQTPGEPKIQGLGEDEECCSTLWVKNLHQSICIHHLLRQMNVWWFLSDCAQYRSLSYRWTPWTLFLFIFLSALVPVTLDPNTAHPCLCLSDDLTGLQYGSLAPHLPGNPERFRVSAEVLGSTGFRTGRHSWVVDTTTNEDWILGLAYRSVQRNAEVFARPENGFWTLCLRDGVYRAMTSPPTVLTLSGKPKQIRVELDWEGGEVTFTDPEEDTTLYTLTQTFEETVLPYFCTRSKHPLRISPEPAKCHQKSLESGQPVKSSDSFCNGLDLYPDWYVLYMVHVCAGLAKESMRTNTISHQSFPRQGKGHLD